MKSIIFLATLLFSCHVHADAQAEQFYRANKLFQEQQYQDARSEYEGLVTKGSLIWYNIGVCFVYEENYVDALINFKKALKGAQYKILPQIFEGIDCAQSHLHTNPQKDETMRNLYKYTSFFSIFWAQMMFLFFWFLVCICWIYKNKTSRLLLLLVSVCVIWSSASLAAVSWLRSREYVIVVKKSNLFAGPHEEYHSVGNIDVAEQLILLDSKNSWYKVKSSSTVGWVKEEICKQV